MSYPSPLLKFRVPGKLFLLGEYAVLEPNSPAIVWAVDRYLQVGIQPSDTWRIQSDIWPEGLSFHWHESQLWSSIPQSDFAYYALQTILLFLEQEQCLPEPAIITVSSELQQDGIKLGLGSSAALTVALMGGVMAHGGYNLNQPEVSKQLLTLAFQAHKHTQQGGSGADIASAALGGIRHYQRSPFGPVTESLMWPDTFVLAVGWTGQPASTATFLPRFKQFQTNQPQHYHTLIEESKTIVNQSIQAIHQQDFVALSEAWQANHQWLIQLDHLSQMGFITEKMHQGIALATQMGIAAKQSGAGGGDCLIALCPDQDSGQQLYLAWQQQGIQPLALNTGFPRLLKR